MSARLYAIPLTLVHTRKTVDTNPQAPYTSEFRRFYQMFGQGQRGERKP
jgi:hypothetical protein